ncbi:MAG: hypothetical protein K2H61_08960 [Muribaculaceae bacterium]|nr:hypothetical protein [Muribaculaceae bacterium]
MKTLSKLMLLCLVALTVASCGGAGGSASGPFGNIPAEIQKYQDADSSSPDDYKKKKKATIEKIEKMANELSGKELDVEVGEGLKIDKPLTFQLESMNVVRPVVKFEGSIVAAEDLTLNVDPKDLYAAPLLGGTEIVITVKMPVSMDCLAADGSVIKTYGDVGTLKAENLKTSAVVKAGTEVELRTFCIVEGLEGTQKLRFYIDPDKTAYTSRGLAQ